MEKKIEVENKVVPKFILLRMVSGSYAISLSADLKFEGKRVLEGLQSQKIACGAEWLHLSSPDRLTTHHACGPARLRALKNTILQNVLFSVWGGAGPQILWVGAH